MMKIMSKSSADAKDKDNIENRSNDYNSEAYQAKRIILHHRKKIIKLQNQSIF